MGCSVRPPVRRSAPRRPLRRYRRRVPETSGSATAIALVTAALHDTAIGPLLTEVVGELLAVPDPAERARGVAEVMATLVGVAVVGIDSARTFCAAFADAIGGEPQWTAETLIQDIALRLQGPATA